MADDDHTAFQTCGNPCDTVFTGVAWGAMGMPG